MVDCANGQLRPSDPQSPFPQPIERPATGAFLREVAIDVDQRPSTTVVANDVLVLDPVEGGIGHVPLAFLLLWREC
jgi:hypothetical protein